MSKNIEMQVLGANGEYEQIYPVPAGHASSHAIGGGDEITPASIGAATSDHTHSNYAASSHNHAASNITSGTLGVDRGGTGKSSVTSGNFLVGNGTSALTEKTPAQVLSAIGAAASSHNHSASNITSGTLAVARGGTGVTANPSMLTNLGSTSAASVFAASPRPGITGILPVANGGTGTNNLTTLATNMGAAKIQTGSYTGTGTYGDSNPCSLTFNFAPKLFSLLAHEFSDEVGYTQISSSYNSDNYYPVLFVNPCVDYANDYYTRDRNIHTNVVWGTNYIRWYAIEKKYNSKYFDASD